jgi:hypothetical protein
VIRLGLRLTLSGGREALVRLVVAGAAVALGVAMLLITVAGINALDAQAHRSAWLETGTSASGPSSRHTRSDAGAGNAPLWWLATTDQFANQAIDRVDVAATGPTSPVSPGIPHLPGPGQYYASPALEGLMTSTPRDQLAARFPGRQIGTIAATALPAPNSLILVVGYRPEQLANLPGAQQVRTITTTLSGSDLEWILAVAALALVFPILVLIATASRLSSARREQRFAAMRLIGATPSQVAVIATVESAVAAILGVVVGFALFFAVRPALYHVPFTGEPFAPGDLSLGPVDALLVMVGVPLAAVASARLALRRVQISPLGVSRRVTPAPPRALRLVPLVLGIVELAYFVGVGKPKSTTAQVQTLILGFLLVLVGLVLSGSWFTMVGGRLIARRTSRASALIAGRRLSDDPRGAFRAIAGLVIALFVTTVSVGVIGTIVADRGAPSGGTVSTDTLVDQFCGVTAFCTPGTYEPAPQASLASRLDTLPGVRGLAVVRQDPSYRPDPTRWRYPEEDRPTGLVLCSQLAATPAVGRCAPGAKVARVGYILAQGASSSPVASHVWPAANVSPERLRRLPMLSVVVATDGTTAAVERARTALQVAFPLQGPPTAVNEITPDIDRTITEFEDMTDVVIAATLIIAACSLAVSVTSSMSDRKRPFSLLRLTGVPVTILRRIVGLEAAVPLLVVAVVSIAAGLVASDLYLRSELSLTLRVPGPGYYGVLLAGLALSLGIVGLSLPLIQRITGPENARNE